MTYNILPVTHSWAGLFISFIYLFIFIFLAALYEANDTVKEAELWSCYFMRRIFSAVKLVAKPYVVLLRKIYHLVHK